MTTCGRIVAKTAELMTRHKLNRATVNVDDDGVGGGVTDRLRKVFAEKNLRVEVNGCHNGGKSRDPHYANQATESWFALRDRFVSGDISIPNDEVLTAQLATRKYALTSSDKLILEDKSSYKKRAGRSPDRADALVLAFAPCAFTKKCPNIPTKSEPVTVANSVWVNGGDDKLHPMAIDALGSQLLGGDASNIPRMNSRLTQAEVNLSNLFTQLKAERELGIQGNLMMIEPFSDGGDCVDKYSCDVMTAVAGISNIQIESDRNVQVGSWYTITDGTRSEYVQVKSVARNGAAVIVILNQIIANTYDLTRTQLLRTSALVTDGQATGAGDIRTTTFNVNETFTGTGGNVETILQLDTSQSNAGNFVVTGDGTFSEDGYFTISA